MTEQEHQEAPESEEFEEEEFVPRGSMFLTVAYIIVFAIAWGSIYFGELLARR